MASPAVLHLLVFSRARPLQLHGYLASLFAQLQDPEAVRVTVLVDMDAPYRAAYQEVFSRARVGRSIGVVEGTDFAHDLREVVQWTREPLFAFGVDDAVYVGPVSVAHLTSAFQDTPDLLAYSLRLGRNVTHSMFYGPVAQPHFQRVEGSTDVQWETSTGDAIGDWGYPWEVVGTVYPTPLVLTLVDLLCAEGGVTSPNLLEHRGAQRWPAVTPLRRMQAAERAAVVVPTVNVVQRDFANGIVGSVPLTPAFLLTCWQAGLCMDVEAFQRQHYQQVHVPDFYLRRRDA